jgi:hypothetical protein
MRPLRILHLKQTLHLRVISLLNLQIKQQIPAVVVAIRQLDQVIALIKVLIQLDQILLIALIQQ